MAPSPRKWDQDLPPPCIRIVGPIEVNEMIKSLFRRSDRPPTRARWLTANGLFLNQASIHP
eukprot:scaffold2310_cov164-Amphora_coffeaeformis.AAC.4